jgi:hypothetical protein
LKVLLAAADARYHDAIQRPIQSAGDRTSDHRFRTAERWLLIALPLKRDGRRRGARAGIHSDRVIDKAEAGALIGFVDGADK